MFPLNEIKTCVQICTYISPSDDIDNVEVRGETKKRMYISLPKKYIAELAKTWDLAHGLVITELNPYLNEGYVQAYFREWGNITSCQVKRQGSGKSKSVAFVRFTSEDEADEADWAGPHYIGGTEVKVKRFVSPATGEDPEENIISVAKPRRSMGLGYILEDAQWLEDEDDSTE